MSHSTTASIRLHVSPSVRRALRELSSLLDEYGYSPTIREGICAYVARVGTLAGAPGLDACDEPDAEMVYVSELEPVPFDSEAWDRQDLFLDLEMLADGSHPLPFGPGPDDSDRSIPPVGLVPPLLEDLAAALPPIAGGAPDDDGPEFTPSPEDWADYRAHFDGAECLYGYE